MILPSQNSYELLHQNGNYKRITIHVYELGNVFVCRLLPIAMTGKSRTSIDVVRTTYVLKGMLKI